MPVGRCLAGLVSARPQYTDGASFDVVVESVRRRSLRIGIWSATTAYAPPTWIVGIPLNNDTNDHTPLGILTQDVLRAYQKSKLGVAQCYLFMLAEIDACCSMAVVVPGEYVTVVSRDAQ